MIGLIGTAITNLAPEGKVFVHGEYWNAIALHSADAGARVKVTAIDGLKLDRGSGTRHQMRSLL